MTFKDKLNREILIRAPRWEDLEQLTTFINKVSQENTFIRYSGEVLTLEEEGEWLKGVLEKSEAGDYLMLLAFHDDQLVGSTTIERDKSASRRSLHVGIFGLVVAQDYRGVGIGEALAQAVIDQASTQMENLRLIRLNVFAPNDKAYKLYQKLGFKEVGRLPEYVLHNGEYIDEIVMVRKCV